MNQLSNINWPINEYIYATQSSSLASQSSIMKPSEFIISDSAQDSILTELNRTLQTYMAPGADTGFRKGRSG